MDIDYFVEHLRACLDQDGDEVVFDGVYERQEIEEVLAILEAAVNRNQ